MNLDKLLNEAVNYTTQQIEKAISDLANDFMYKADKFMPDPNEIADEYGGEIDDDAAHDIAENFFDEFYPQYASGNKALNKFIVDNHYKELIDSIASAIKSNFE